MRVAIRREWGVFIVLASAACGADTAPPKPAQTAGSGALTSAGSTAAGSGGVGRPTTPPATAGRGQTGTPPPVMMPTPPSAAGSAAAGTAAPRAGNGAAGAAGAAGVPAGGAAAPAGGADAPPPADAMEPKIPEPKAECVPFKTGDMMFAGSRVKIWAGEKKAKTGPVIIYWYATGGSVAEVNQGIPAASITEITGAGGIIAAMYQTTSKGMNTGNNVWYTGDYDVTDEVIACAAKIHDVDTHHIHALGWSAGGLQSGYMAYFRSSYMASVAPYSGGSLNMTLQDPSNVPAAMLFHGAEGVDMVIIDFSVYSDRMGADLKMKGGFALNCNHNGAHMIPTAPGPAAAQLFFKAHGFKTKPSPWATMIPTGVPAYCKPY